MRILSAVLVVIAVLACSSSTKLPPVEPEDVEVYMPGQQYMLRDYVVIWETNDESSRRGGYNIYSPARTDEQIIQDLKEEAAKRGADAIVIEWFRGTTAREGREGTIVHDQRLTPASGSYGRAAQKSARALAICFLDRHPELAEKK